MAAETDDLESDEEFQNPNCKPLEDLVLQIERNKKVETYPAIDDFWSRNRPFLDYENPPEKNENDEYSLGAKKDWLERSKSIAEDLEWLMGLKTYRFWSQVIFQEDSLNAVKTFVECSTPFYLKGCFNNHRNEDEEIHKAFMRIEYLVFNVFLRITTCKESEIEWMREKTFGKMLYDNYIITVPFLMSVCLCFGKNNHSVLSEAVFKVFQYQSRYIEDVHSTVELLNKVLKYIEEQLNCGRVGGEEPVKLSQRPTNQKTLNIQSLSALIICLMDSAYSVTSFMDIYKPAATLYHENHFEIMIADFYENSVPALFQQIDLVCNLEETFEVYIDLKFKVNQVRRELLNAFHLVLSSCVNNILQLKEELEETSIKRLGDEYIAVLTDCLANRMFMSDYQKAFPVEHQLDILAQLCPEIDAYDFIFESVISCLNDNPVKTKKQFSVSNHYQNSNHTNTSDYQSGSSRSTATVRKVTGVELESLIFEVKDILPHLGDGFIEKCLNHFSYDSAAVINAILEGSLPEPLVGLDPEMPYIPHTVENKESNGVLERVNVFDNDEFDIMNRDDVDTSRMHIGKRKSKHKNLNQMLDDKSYVNQMRDMYTRLSIVESNEDNLYEDEYDDTYDEAAMAVGDEGETERRPFTIPRVLQRRVSLPDEQEEDDVPEDSEEKDKHKFEYFVPNPEEVRAKAEQWRRDHYRGRGRGSSNRDVVGRPKGQGQEKQVLQNRENKTVYKSRSANHNRRAMASRKRNQGMVPF